MSARLFGLLAVALLWLGAAGVAAAEDPPIVVLALDGAWPSELGAEVRADLRASLRERGLALVDEGETPGRAVATIRIEAPDLDHPVARIEIDDRVNQKRVEREVALGSEPVDTWSVVLAAAADELLRAAWVELTMPDAPPPAMTPPPEVERAARESVAPEGPVDGRLGVVIAAALEGYTGGAVLAGADLVFSVLAGGPVAIDAGVSVRGLVPATSRLGVLDGLAVGGEIGLRGALLGRAGLARLDLLAAVRAAWLDLRPSPVPGAIAERAEGALVAVRGGVRFALALPGTVHVGVTALIGVPIVGAVAVDAEGQRLAAIEGAELGLRIEVSLWP